MDTLDNNGMNFSRQEELYDGTNNTDSVTIIGTGATGSWVALALAKLGVRAIELYDMDLIELHNVPNQLYSKSDVDKFKVDICKQYMNILGSGVSNIAAIKR